MASSCLAQPVHAGPPGASSTMLANRRGSQQGGKPIFPSPPAAPMAASVEPMAVVLEWAPPSSSGSTGLKGYRVDVRAGGTGDFSVIIAHTQDTRPRARLDGLIPMTWYQFRVAAINGSVTGPHSPESEPILTRATEELQKATRIAMGPRRRRTQQSAGGAAVAAEREAHARLAAHEAELTREVERSVTSMALWEEVFQVRHGRAAREEDRQESSVLRDEAHSLLVLRHSLAEACLATLDAERALVLTGATHAVHTAPGAVAVHVAHHSRSCVVRAAGAQGARDREDAADPVHSAAGRGE